MSVFSKPMFCLFAFLPTDTSIFSAVKVCCSLLTSALIVTPSSLVKLSANKLAFVINIIPFFSSCFCAAWEMVMSSVGKIWSAYSRTVTFTPKSASMDAHSIPITPPPTIKIDVGKVFIFKASVELITVEPSMSRPGNVLGFEPVAIKTFSARSLYCHRRYHTLWKLYQVTEKKYSVLKYDQILYKYQYSLLSLNFEHPYVMFE